MLRKIKILLLLPLLLSGCSLFGLRDVEEPTAPRSNFVPPTSPDLVLVNMQSAITDKDINNYLQCLVDSSLTGRKFRFIADVTSQIQYPIFRTWDLTNERNYFYNLLALTSPQSTSLFFYSNVNSLTYSDSAIYDMDYLLRFDHQKTSVPKTLTGKLRFIMVMNSKNLWAISTWTDFKSADTDTTWSVLKANFSN